MSVCHFGEGWKEGLHCSRVLPQKLSFFITGAFNWLKSGAYFRECISILVEARLVTNRIKQLGIQKLYHFMSI